MSVLAQQGRKEPWSARPWVQDRVCYPVECGLPGLRKPVWRVARRRREVIERFRVAELVARPLELGFLSLPPEFFRALHAAVDSFHFGIAQHRGQRKADAAPA